METVGLIGLGVMGAPMGGHLINAGYALSVYDRIPERMPPLLAEGARACTSAAAVAAQADVVVVMVRDEPELEVALFGPQGLAEGLRAGAALVIGSTVSAGAVRSVAQRLAPLQVAVLDAPVSGGRAGAEAAALAIMVGGDPAVFARVAPLLRVLGQTVTHVGPLGSGQVAKAANQIILSLTRAAIGEACRLARAEQVDPERVLKALQGGAAECASLHGYAPRVVAAEDPVEFTSAILRKDLLTIAARLDALGLELPFTALVTAKYREAGSS